MSSSFVRRKFRQLRARYGRPQLDLVYSSGYQLQLSGALHDPERGEKILAWLAGQKLLRTGSVREPHGASIRTLQRVHDDDYLESLRDAEAFTKVLGYSVSEADRDRILELQREMVGGTILAVRLALTTDRTTFNLGGGLHHAFADRGERFCLFNDVAVAIATERARNFAGRVLVVDLDLHDGDGMRSLFAHDETVHTYSIHNETNQAEDVPEATVIELGTGVDDETYLDALRETLPEVFQRFRPQLVIYLAGVDPARDDELGDWHVSADALLERDRFVVEQAREAPEEPPLAIVLAGGYGESAWRYSARFAGWLITGEELPLPPTEEEETLTRYRHLAKTFTRRELTSEAEEDDDPWTLTEEDVLGALAGSRERTRFLDYYSLHGIELALEKAGLLQEIRDLGYAEPTFELDLENPSGDTLRLFGDAQKTELLVELRAKRDKSVVSGMELLRVEWLLMQNPRASFPPERPPLPGQRYPGLGMLTDVASFLVLICDRLGLDGVFFVPSHYHLAAQSRKMLQFLDPEHEAEFRAMRSALETLPLAEATRAVAQGRVVDAETGEPVQWNPAPMVLPVSDRLDTRLCGEEYEERVREIRDRLRYKLA